MVLYQFLRYFIKVKVFCIYEGLVDVIGFWEWNFNDNFLCNIYVIEVVGEYFKGQENFIRDVWYDRESFGKNFWYLKI